MQALAFSNNLLDEARLRGFIHQQTHTELLKTALDAPPVTLYVGFDPTANSLHVGHLSLIMLMRLFQQRGHRICVILGGGTALIGDPSGRDEARLMLTTQQIHANIQRIQHSLRNLLPEALFLDNAMWLQELSYVEFLRDIGRYFSVNKMLAMESVRLRLDRQQPLTFIEFNYSLLQAYDFLHLYDTYECRLQLGGSDQWGNILAGMDLVGRLRKVDVFGMTTPLVTTSDGRKMGKTAQGAIWLDAELYSVHDFWQFWRCLPDADVVRFLKLFTSLSLEDISLWEAVKGEELNNAKILLADNVTRLVHGQEALTLLRQDTLSGGQAQDLFKNYKIKWHEVEEGSLSVLECLVGAQLCSSKSEARQRIREGAVRLASRPITGELYKISLQDLDDPASRSFVLSVGRKKIIVTCL